jgi:hypothetical protein
MRAIQFERSDCGDGATEVLTVCRIDAPHPLAGELVIQVEAGRASDSERDFVGLYDLDGDALDVGNSTWSIVRPEELSAEKIADIEASWETGTSTVRRVEVQS